MIAVAFAWILRGPGDVGGMAAARGMLDPTVRAAIHATTAPEPTPPPR